MRVLAIGAHHDDVELGCGGTLLAWAARGAQITIFTASSSGYAAPDGREIRGDLIARQEGERAAGTLGATLLTGGFKTFELEFSEPLNQAVLGAMEAAAPDVVLTHWPGDTHHDHRALALASVHCCRRVPRVLFYCSNWYEAVDRFDPRFFVDISRFLDAKCALIETYASEVGRTGGTWVEHARAQARINGLKAGVHAAEAFEVLKWLDP